MVSPVAMSANATMAMTLPVIQKRVGRQHVPVGPDGHASSWGTNHGTSPLPLNSSMQALVPSACEHGWSTP
jgi:hypothetical protein